MLICLQNEHLQLEELEPLCVLDFYVHESAQRSGTGRMLFDAMLAKEKTISDVLAYDRPSPKFRNFLRRHFDLHETIQQDNNFMIFRKFFAAPSSKSVRSNELSLDVSALVYEPSPPLEEISPDSLEPSPRSQGNRSLEEVEETNSVFSPFRNGCFMGEETKVKKSAPASTGKQRSPAGSRSEEQAISSAESAWGSHAGGPTPMLQSSFLPRQNFLQSPAQRSGPSSFASSPQVPGTESPQKNAALASTQASQENLLGKLNAYGRSPISRVLLERPF